jgi:outer membrane protein OmpA-like peptidoglycan-associated protein
VLPSATGKAIGGIMVSNGTTDTTLDQSFAAAELRGGALEPCQVSKVAVDTTFRQAIAARPVLPHHFRLYFLPNSDQLTPESSLQYREALADIAQRRAYQIEVIGYTDSLGTPGDDRQLSLARAAAVRRLLARDRIDAGRISVTGRGKLDLLIPTADQVAEPRNRRVEIWVR